MNYLYYASIYLAIGTIIMVILDVMHLMVKNHVDDEFKGGYKNWERVYIIFMWPTFTYALLRQIIKDKQN